MWRQGARRWVRRSGGRKGGGARVHLGNGKQSEGRTQCRGRWVWRLLLGGAITPARGPLAAPPLLLGVSAH